MLFFFRCVQFGARVERGQCRFDSFVFPVSCVGFKNWGFGFVGNRWDSGCVVNL